MFEKLLIFYKDSEVMQILPKQTNDSLNSQTDFDMTDIIDFFTSWKNGLNRRFMVKEIQNKFRFGVAFSFLHSSQYKHESILFVLIR
jgi:hypothetical protein